MSDDRVLDRGEALASFIDRDWPRQDLGRPSTGRPEESADVLAGRVLIDGEMLDPGRIYTSEEWGAALPEVGPWLDARSRQLDALLGCAGDNSRMGRA